MNCGLIPKYGRELSCIIKNTDVLSITMPMINWMKIEDKSNQTIKSYVRAVDRLVRFHDLIHPRELDIDEVLDFLVSNMKDRWIEILQC